MEIAGEATVATGPWRNSITTSEMGILLVLGPQSQLPPHCIYCGSDQASRCTIRLPKIEGNKSAGPINQLLRYLLALASWRFLSIQIYLCPQHARRFRVRQIIRKLCTPLYLLSLLATACLVYVSVKSGQREFPLLVLPFWILTFILTLISPEPLQVITVDHDIIQIAGISPELLTQLPELPRGIRQVHRPFLSLWARVPGEDARCGRP